MKNSSLTLIIMKRIIYDVILRDARSDKQVTNWESGNDPVK